MFYITKSWGILTLICVSVGANLIFTNRHFIKNQAINATINVSYQTLRLISILQIKINKCANLFSFLKWPSFKHRTQILMLDENGREVNEDYASHVLIIDTPSNTKCANYIFNELSIFKQNENEFLKTNKYPYVESKISFMCVELEYDNKIYLINMRDISHNFYIVNNSLNSLFFKYYIRYFLKLPVNNLNFEYKATVIDDNVNAIAINSNNSVIIKDTNYILVKEGHCSKNN